jgi:hypothetical protein
MMFPGTGKTNKSNGGNIMDHFEMVEKLRERANVSYEEAKDALEAADWNLLDALVILESQGKVTGESAYSTKADPKEAGRAGSHAERAGRVGRQLASGINRLNRYVVVVARREENLFELPLLAVILLVAFGFWITVPLLIVGLFFGFKYSLRGAEGVEAVNRVMDKASEVADSIIHEVRKDGKDGKDNQ